MQPSKSSLKGIRTPSTPLRVSSGVSFGTASIKLYNGSDEPRTPLIPLTEEAALKDLDITISLDKKITPVIKNLDELNEKIISDFESTVKKLSVVIPTLFTSIQAFLLDSAKDPNKYWQTKRKLQELDNARAELNTARKDYKRRIIRSIECFAKIIERDLTNIELFIITPLEELLNIADKLWNDHFSDDAIELMTNDVEKFAPLDDDVMSGDDSPALPSARRALVNMADDDAMPVCHVNLGASSVDPLETSMEDFEEPAPSRPKPARF